MAGARFIRGFGWEKKRNSE